MELFVHIPQYMFLPRTFSEVWWRDNDRWKEQGFILKWSDERSYVRESTGK
jgi:hypothetical protein